ncbi:hypothetical protein ANN_21278 [Periplaneta americana]|uniref:RNase H type-1 domain-containing protein n=1 Tax=Periplaneta americana TaxID=6978 RepID=A0ABQ8SF03_PERAM|nr:hypothetical protein ANN_21278 [Periplaneta americana]
MAGLCKGGNEPPGSLKASKYCVTSSDDIKITLPIPQPVDVSIPGFFKPQESRFQPRTLIMQDSSMCMSLVELFSQANLLISADETVNCWEVSEGQFYTIALYLGQHQIKSKLIWDCLNAQIAMSSHNRLKVRWISGHQGVQGNENADELAKKGTNIPFVGPEPVVGISLLTAKTSVKTWIKDRHQFRWQSYPRQKLARKLVLGPNNSFFSSLLKLDRRGVRSVVALITRHVTSGNTYVQWEPICRMCKQEEETVLHILFDCSLLERKRFSLSITREDIETNTNVGAKKQIQTDVLAAPKNNDYDDDDDDDEDDDDDNNVHRLDWPAQSPDLNPIERRLRSREMRPTSIVQLSAMLEEEWRRIPVGILHKLVEHDRVAAVISTRGGTTRF